MQTKGQLFATDFLIAMTIIILGLGMLGAASEFNMYQNKELTNYGELQEKAEAAAITLSNSTWSDCNLGATEMAYSINRDKISALSGGASEVKKRLGVSDYNIQILFDNLPLSGFPNDTGTPNSKNIAGIDLNVVLCRNTVAFFDLNKCMNTNLASCFSIKINRVKLTIKVGK